MGKLWNYLKSIFFCCRRDQEGAILYISFHLGSSKTKKSKPIWLQQQTSLRNLRYYTKLGEEMR